MKQDQREVFSVALITIIGLAIRLLAPLTASFPLNDGGLFYQMILELQENDFTLPAITTYNHANIPFAYPPLSFYLYGFFSKISGVPLLDLVQFAPAVVSSFTVPAFYFLAKNFISTKQASFAALAFALVPRAFDWLIMGGGVARSLGFLFAILAMHQIYLLFSAPSNHSLVLTTMLSGIVVSTHLEATVHTAIAALFLYLWKDRTLKGALRAAFVAIGTLGITSPWWVLVIAHHGFSPFQAAISAAGVNSIDLVQRIFALLKFDFTDEPFVQFISVFGLIGLFILLAQRKPALPIWFLLIETLEPRGGSLFLMLPTSMFAGVALDQALSSSLITERGKTHPWAWYAFIVFFLFYGLVSASTTASHIIWNLTLTDEDLNAFAWVKRDTPPESKFLLVTQGLPLNDSASEWFPVLTQRTSIATIFGYEWVNDGKFNLRARTYEEIQKCHDRGISCIYGWSKIDDGYYIVIRKKLGDKGSSSVLLEQLQYSNDYRSVYETRRIIIFEKIAGQP